MIGHKCKHDPIFFLDNFNVHVCAEYENEPSDLPEEPTTGNPILDKQCAFKCRCVQTKNIIALEVGREYIVEEVREVKMALKSLIKSYTQCRIGQARFSADCFEILP